MITISEKENAMKIAIDAMGGDHAPKEIVLGALKALETFQGFKYYSCR